MNQKKVKKTLHWDVYEHVKLIWKVTKFVSAEDYSRQNLDVLLLRVGFENPIFLSFVYDAGSQKNIDI